MLPRWRDLRDQRVMEIAGCAPGLDGLDQYEGGRLPGVIHVFLVGGADQQDAGTL